MLMSDKLMTVKEACRRVGVADETLRRAMKAGTLPAVKTSKAGRWRIDERELEAYLARTRA